MNDVRWSSDPERGTLIVSGRDRTAWLNGVLTADVSHVVPGRGAWALALSKQGKVQSELWLLAAGESLLVGAAPGTTDALVAHLDRLLVMEDAEVRDATGEFGWFCLLGVEAPRVAAEVALALRGHSGAIPWSPGQGAALAVPRGRAAEASTLLAEVGATTEGFEAARIRAGVPRFGVDYTSAHNPHDASLDQRAVSWTKGCYLGQEVVCMQGMRGKVRRRVVSLMLDAPREPGVEVAAADGPAGVLTSVSPAAGGAVALALVRAPHDATGTLLDAGGVAARVVEPA